MPEESLVECHWMTGDVRKRGIERVLDGWMRIGLHAARGEQPEFIALFHASGADHRQPSYLSAVDSHLWRHGAAVREAQQCNGALAGCFQPGLALEKLGDVGDTPLEAIGAFIRVRAGLGLRGRHGQG